MSPRAAWRLEEAGFGPVYDYVAGKSDWLAADLPFEGSAQLAGMFTRHQVATSRHGLPAGMGQATICPARVTRSGACRSGAAKYCG